MRLIYFRVIILTHFLLLQVPAEETCDNSICNYEAICTLQNGKPTCKCVRNLFEDEFCTKPVDHCISNPCKNGGTCHPYLGHYYCECPAGFSAQTCTSKQDTFKGLHLHYNHIVPIGTQQNLILMVETIGTVETLMDFFTPDYIIDGFAFTSTSEHFKPSNDLKALAKRLGIRHSDTIPYKKGFYRRSYASFWKLGTYTMALDLSDFGHTEENFFTEHFDILVYDPLGERCLPIVHLPHCSNPRKPLHLDIIKYNFIEPIVDKRCAPKSHLKIKWTVNNYIDTVLLHRFPDEAGSSVLTIRPYTMWFNYRDDYVQSYMIKGDFLEVNTKGNVISKSIIRCYVFVDSKPTTARIIGDTYREVNVAKGFQIDGSISRDYARRPNRDQELKYSWSCSSEDTNNPHCLKDMGNDARIRIPSGAFQLNQTYKFTLHIQSTINIYSTHETSQDIKAVDGDSLFLHFHCLRNCEHDKFAAGKVIHLKIECIECPSGEVEYSVYNEQGTKVATSETVIITAESKTEVILKAEATLGPLKGTTSIKLGLNSPPLKGSCKISPESGTEYTTFFKISCSGFEDDENPIDYKFIAGTTTLYHSGNDTIVTRLFPTAGNICEIKINICDDIEACTVVQIQASLSPISSNGSWLNLVTNLSELLENGDRSAAIILSKNVIPRVPKGEIFDVAKQVVESFRHIELIRLLAVEQVLSVVSDLFEAIELSSNSVVLVSELYLKVSDGLIHSIRNGEVIEQPLEIHEQMIASLTQTMSRTSMEVEEFPTVHDAEIAPVEDPFLENYPDYGELIMEDVVRVSNWLQSFNRVHQCLQIMGVVSAFIQLPHESAMMTKMNSISSRTVVIDNTNSVSISWNESNTFISLPSEFLKAFKGVELAVQILIFEANPFWWNPSQHKIGTEVLSVGVYSKDLQSLESRSTNVKFEYYMALKSKMNITDDNLIRGTVKGSLDMLVYERLLPPHGVLVVTFLPLENDIRILFMIGERPRSYMLTKAKSLRSSKDNTTTYFVNSHSTECKTFLAIASKTRTKYTFTWYIRVCLTWDAGTYEWTSRYCSVGNQTNSTHIHCTCWHLSMFGAKVHPTFGILQQSRNIVQSLPFNYYMLVFYLVVILLMYFLLWLAWQQDKHAAKSLVMLNSKPICEDNHKYLVTIYTNGHLTAATSSNVSIQLHGTLSDSEQYTLYSNPNLALFRRNLPTSFTLSSANSLGALVSISLKLDNFGRYPSWNCHLVKVRDEVHRNEYIFLVDKWLLDDKLIQVPLAKEKDLQKRWRIFKDTLADTFANWYAQQAISPFRLYDNLTAMEKTAIFISRACITLGGILIAFGPTTMFTYEQERETYYSMLLRFGRLLLIAVCCHLLGVAVAVLLRMLFVKLSSSQKNVTYNLCLSNESYNKII